MSTVLGGPQYKDIQQQWITAVGTQRDRQVFMMQPSNLGKHHGHPDLLSRPQERLTQATADTEDRPEWLRIRTNLRNHAAKTRAFQLPLHSSTIPHLQNPETPGQDSAEVLWLRQIKG